MQENHLFKLLYLNTYKPKSLIMKSSTAAVIIGVLFLAVGLLGFIPNPIVGDSENVIFHADQVHNIVHIASGALFILFGLAMPASASGFMMFFGIVYLFLGVLGLINIGTTGEGKLLGFLHVNGADNLLHIGLGILIFLMAAIRPRTTVRV